MLFNVQVPHFAITGTETQVQTQPSVISATTCASNTNPSITYNVYDSIKQGTLLNTDYNLAIYITNSAGVAEFQRMINAGTAFNAAEGSHITIYATDIDGTHDVYGFVDSIDVPCTSTVPSFNSYRGMQDGALTTTVYASDNITAVTAVAPETIAAGGTLRGRLRIVETTADAYWSTTQEGQKFALTADLNKNCTSTGDFALESITPAAKSVTLVSTPSHITSADPTNNPLQVTYEIVTDALRDQSGLTETNVNFRLPALTVLQNPGNDCNILFVVSDKEMYQNATTGKWLVDYTNTSSNAGLGETDATDVYHVA